MVGLLLLAGVALAAPVDAAASADASASADAAAPVGAAEAVVDALARDPALAAAEATVLSARGAARAACGLRSDPVLQGGIALVGEAWSVSLMQPVSLSGEGAAACAEARAEAEAAARSWDRARLESAAGTRRAWAAAVASRQQRSLCGDALAAAEAVLRATRSQRALGEAAELDLQLAHLQVERVRTAALAAVLTEAETVGALAARLGVAPDALVLPADPLDAAPAAERGGGPRSDTAAADARERAAEAGLRRAGAGSLPPARVGVFVEQEGDELRAGPRVQLTLPLWNRGVGERGAAAGAALRAGADAEATRQRARAEQATAGDAAARVEALLGAQAPDLPAQARAALAGAAAAHAAGELDILDVSTLQAQVLAGHAAWLEGRRLAAEARIQALLAVEDPRLLGAR